MARIAALRAGLPDIVPGVTINRFCSSGLQSIAMAADRIRAGGAEIIIAGGSRIDEHDARWRATSSRPIRGSSTTGPRSTWAWDSPPSSCSSKYGISREEQDAFSLRSHQNALRAQAEGKFDEEIVPLEVERRRASRRDAFTKDEGPRADTSLEALAKLKPVFHASGTVTAGNSSQTSDGAAAALVMSERKARELGLKPMARFVSFAVGGVPPEIMGIGPVVAIPKALALAGLEARRHRRDRAERSVRRAGAGGDPRSRARPRRVNVNGGAIALGHPLGCTGAKLTATILREMKRRRCALRHGDDVRRRRPGRGRHLRKDELA